MKKILLTFIIFSIYQYNGFAQGVSDYRTYHLEGRDKIGQGDFEGAIASYDASIKKMPYYPAVYLDRADAKSAIKDYQGAILDYSHVIEKQDFNYKAFRGRGIVYYQMQQFQKAKQDFEACLKLSPEDKEAKKYLAFINEELALQAQQAQMERSKYEAQQRAWQERREYEQRVIRNVIVWGVLVPTVIWRVCIGRPHYYYHYHYSYSR
ncbi:MAG: tetratricopeptide repeat protein [Cytophagales bacterium]|nr:MAG: tetratricopeptide repeat protein [Cytophagales bacterium]